MLFFVKKEEYMNYYNEIKEQLINNEVYKKAKDYSKNRSDLNTYYNVGKLIVEAQGGEERAKYGNKLIKEYSANLINEVGRMYNERTLRRIRQFYITFKNWSPMATNLSWSHYTELLPLKDNKAINYYLNICINQKLSKMELRNRIKNREYERLDEHTIQKLMNNEETIVSDLIKNPILIKNSYSYTEITEKILKQLILEDLENFLIELGEGFTFIKSEYKIKLGDRYNYIDLLLFNYKYNCFAVVELKVTELKKQRIGQIQIYMNYIDKNIKSVYQDKTIGIIICKKENKFIIEYSSDSRIFETSYELC
jgi:predicted nuclease of restriction endonuclease-like (RecB) superfamily